MKVIIMALIGFVCLSASDIQRVNDMINDIQNLKKNSQQLIKTSNNYEKVFKQRIAILEDKLDKQSVELQAKPKVIVKTVTLIKEKDDNPFPKLQMKSKYFTAGTFRVSEDAEIYDEENGKVIDTWESGTSFTSSKRTDSMIKITGYFVDKVWRSSEKSMWIKSNNAFER